MYIIQLFGEGEFEPWMSHLENTRRCQLVEVQDAWHHVSNLKGTLWIWCWELKNGLMLKKKKSYLLKAISKDSAIWRILTNFYAISEFQAKICMARSFWGVICRNFPWTCSHLLLLTWIWYWKFIESHRLEETFYDTSVLDIFYRDLLLILVFPFDCVCIRLS